jgi:hypothetical protein
MLCHDDATIDDYWQISVRLSQLWRGGHAKEPISF